MFELYTLFLFPLYMFPNFLAKYKEIKEFAQFCVSYSLKPTLKHHN